MCPIDPEKKKCGEAPTGQRFKSGVTKDTVCDEKCDTACFDGEVRVRWESACACMEGGKGRERTGDLGSVPCCARAVD